MYFVSLHRIILSALIALVLLMAVTSAEPEPNMRGMGNRYITRVLDRIPAYSGHSIYRRFDYMRPLQDSLPMEKRNNAEVVNHILKNFGALDRLGDVGK